MKLKHSSQVQVPWLCTLVLVNYLVTCQHCCLPCMHIHMHWCYVSTLRKKPKKKNVWMKGCERMEGECGGVSMGETLLLFSLKFTIKTCGSRGGGNRDTILYFFSHLFLFFLSITEKTSDDGSEKINWMDERELKNMKLVWGNMKFQKS